MASLEKIEAELNRKLPENKQIQIISTHSKVQDKTIGHKRRSWIIDNNIIQKEKGSINPVYEPEKEKGSINPVYEPEKEKGSINPVYEPHDISLRKLRGNPLTIVWYIFKSLKKETTEVTCKLTLSNIIENLCISKDSAKTGVRFLLKNKLLERVSFQPGREGWVEYKLKDSLYLELKKATLIGSIDPIFPSKKEKGSIRVLSHLLDSYEQLHRVVSILA